MIQTTATLFKGKSSDPETLQFRFWSKAVVAMAAPCLLLFFNTVHLLFSLALAGTSIWLFLEIQGITALRNVDRHLLDFNVHWTQAAPWIFLMAATFAFCVSFCGLVGAKKRSRGYILTYIVFETVAIVTLIAAAALGLTFVDCDVTDAFIKNTFVEVFENGKREVEVKNDFGKLERRMHCCGADGATDYFNDILDYSANPSLPLSCCDNNSIEWVSTTVPRCDRNNQLARQRHGCAKVFTSYTRLFVRSLSYGAGGSAVIGVISVVIAVFLYRSLSRKTMSDYTDSMDTIKK